MALDTQRSNLQEPAPERGGPPRPLKPGTGVLWRAEQPSLLHSSISTEVGPGAALWLKSGRRWLATRLGAAFTGPVTLCT